MNISPYKIASNANDTLDLLHHIAWGEIIQPALLAEKHRLQDLLAGAVLGSTPIGVDGKPLTVEQLAGMCFGIDYITRLLRTILQRGEKALKEIEKKGINLTSTPTNET